MILQGIIGNIDTYANSLMYHHLYFINHQIEMKAQKDNLNASIDELSCSNQPCYVSPDIYKKSRFQVSCVHFIN